jgi:hypothetical protein
MPELNQLAGSAFVALVFAMIGNIALYRMLLREQERGDIERSRTEKAVGVVGDMALALKENNALLRGALDAVTRRRGS